MSREIKFRAWNKDGYMHWSSRSGETGFWDIAGVFDAVIIEQFTGLRDKNGIEIYEGDYWLYYKCDKCGSDYEEEV